MVSQQIHNQPFPFYDQKLMTLWLVVIGEFSSYSERDAFDQRELLPSLSFVWYKVLSLANIGDSGFLVLRNGVPYTRSSPLFHEFNLPLQIESGVDPSQLMQGYEVVLSEDDVVVMATDGLFDNLYEQEIASIITKSLKAGKGPEEIAENLASRAQEVGMQLLFASDNERKGCQS